jgi:hypothetical protein
MITLDNASNNSTLMEELKLLLAKCKVVFDAKENRIRYDTSFQFFSPLIYMSF